MLAERLKALREAKKLTQKELGDIIGVTRNSVLSYELGAALPSTRHLTELAHLFHCSTDYLLGIDGKNTIDATGLSPQDVALVVSFVNRLRELSEGQSIE